MNGRDLDGAPSPELDGLDDRERATRQALYARYRPPVAQRLPRARRGAGSVWWARITVMMVIASIVGLRWWATRAVPRRIDRSTIDTMVEPLQQPVEGIAPIEWRHENERITIHPLARYRIAARVLGTSRYRFGWQGALVPWDVGLAWGKAATPEVLDHVHFQQSGRWLHYVYGGHLPVDAGYLATHAANNHWIPATDNLRRAIAALDEGDVIEAEGFLVRAERVGGGEWSSSLTREDSGDGACELMYVERLRVGPRVFE